MPKTRKRKKRSASRSVIAIAILSAILYAGNCSGSRSIEISPFNDLGEIDYFGQIINGEIPPDVLERIQDKTVEAISQAALYDYALLKKYAKDNEIIYR